MSKTPLDMSQIFPELAHITDNKTRAGVEAVWEELWQLSPWETIDEVPSSPDFPYSHVRHNHAVLTMALAVADAFEHFHGVATDRGLIVAAGLLQDASKMVEYCRDADGIVTYSEIGKLYPHGFWGAHLALKHGLSDIVCHIILTHTPQSPKFPLPLEGKILYYVDQLDVLAIHKDRWRKELFVTK